MQRAARTPRRDATGLRGKRLLELGCGPGHNAARLAIRYGAAEILEQNAQRRAAG